MSAIEETKKDTAVQRGVGAGKRASALSPLTWLLNLLSSVRFGVVLLILLVAASMTGMLIMQQNIEDFDKYYAALTPSQKLLYGSLGFFDIYHTWYFNALLLVLSLNIILASIDRFPKTWKVVSRRKLEAGRKWLQGQQHHAALVVEGESAKEVAERVGRALRGAGLRATVTEKQGRGSLSRVLGASDGGGGRRGGRRKKKEKGRRVFFFWGRAGLLESDGLSGRARRAADDLHGR